MSLYAKTIVDLVDYLVSFSAAASCLRAKWNFMSRSWKHLWYILMLVFKETSRLLYFSLPLVYFRIHYITLDLFLGLALLLVEVDEIYCSQLISQKFDVSG